jgi:uncharacterized protein YdaU (DUF1376 family)
VLRREKRIGSQITVSIGLVYLTVSTRQGAGFPEFSPDRSAPMEIVMHYFQFNIGDYASHTRHLSLYEDLAYRRLLDAYYLREKPLPKEVELVARLISMNDRLTDVERVLKEFFEATKAGWINKRADEEILRFHKKLATASKAGKASVESKRQRSLNGTSTDVQPTNNHKPITNNQEPIEKKKKKGSAPVSCPPDVDEKVWQDYTATRKSAITETALQILQKEAALAGMTLEAVLSECTMRGWTGFKADWMKNRTTAGNRPLTVWEKSEQQKQEFSDRLWGRSKDDGRTIDATPLKLG